MMEKLYSKLIAVFYSFVGNVIAPMFQIFVRFFLNISEFLNLWGELALKTGIMGDARNLQDIYPTF